MSGLRERVRQRTPVDLYREAAHKAAEEQAASTGGYALGPESPSRLVYGPGGVIALGCSRAQGPSLERLVRLANAAIAAGLEETEKGGEA